MIEDEWVAVWMLNIVKKRKRIDKFIYQSLLDIVKFGGDNVIKNFEDKFKELRVEGHRKSDGMSTSVIFTEEDEYIDDEEEMEEGDSDDNEDEQETQTETEDKEMYFMGMQSQARKRFGRNNVLQSRQPYRNTNNMQQIRSSYHAPNHD